MINAVPNSTETPPDDEQQQQQEPHSHLQEQLTQEQQFTDEDLRERLVALEKVLADPHSECYLERLLDVVVAAVLDSFTLAKKKNVHMYAFFKRFCNIAAYLQSFRRRPTDFSPIASLGRGAFGRVQLVRDITTGRVCAMKVLKKCRMLTQHSDYWAEREIMSHGESPWIVQLYYAFQDVTSLYMVMEFVPGGTLTSWMEEVDMVSEAVCRFYAAEIVLALQDLHAIGFIHRDLKPDNLLLDAGGHLKLVDFGTAIRVDPETRLVHCDSAVGTPDYLSPEVLLSQSAGGGSYGFAVDWWALGVVVYEMFFGDTPFYADNLVNTYAKIMNHSNHLSFPNDVPASEEAIDFMKQLLSDAAIRLGGNWREDAKAVRDHPWFFPPHSSTSSPRRRRSSGSPDESLSDWTWATIRACRPPFQPQLGGETDTAYFQNSTEEDALAGPDDSDLTGDLAGSRENGVVESVSTPQPSGSGGGQEDGISNDTERFLDRFPGVQLSFAGFSFSSSHPEHVTMLNGLYLVPSHRSAGSLPPGASDKVPSIHLHLPVDTPNGVEESNGSCAQGQLNNKPSVSDMTALIEGLEIANLKLAESENCRQALQEECDRRLANLRMETAEELARLEAELLKWKTLAEAEQSARVTAEAAGNTAVATATADLARRAREVADRLVGPTSLCNSHQPLLSPVPMEKKQEKDNEEEKEEDGKASQPDPADDDVEPEVVVSEAANQLLARVEEMARRARQAESSLQEARDALETQKQFAALYKNSCEIKTENLAELQREMQELLQKYDTSQSFGVRLKEELGAAHRALLEEQQRSSRYRELARTAEENSQAASQRVTVISHEAASLRRELELSRQECVAVKVKCTAAVNKLHQVMSDINVDPLELMWSTSQYANASVGVGGLTANDWHPGASPVYTVVQADQDRAELAGDHHHRAGKPATSVLSNVWQGINQQRMQHQLKQRNRENKRLLNEINRLYNDLATSKRQANGLEQRLNIAEAQVAQLSDQWNNRLHHSQHTGDGMSVSPNLTVRRRNPSVQSSGSGCANSMTLSPTPPRSRKRSGILGVADLAGPAFDSTSPKSDSMRHSIFGDYPEALEAVPSQLPPLDFIFSGILEIRSTGGRRKKLSWTAAFIKLTASRLQLLEYPSSLLQSGGDSLSSSSNSLNRQRVPTPNLSSPNILMDLPLTALLHVRSINSCDLFHEPEEELKRILQVIYDRQMLTAVTNPMSSVDDIAGPAKSPSAASGGRGSAMTLPRKLSFGSSSLFSTGNSNNSNASAAGQPTRRGLTRTDSMATRATVGPKATGNHDAVRPTDANVGHQSPAVTSALVMQGHHFQRIHFRMSASCDMCRQPCWHIVHPPLVLQCVHCQFKMHASHYEQASSRSQTKPLLQGLPLCGHAVVVCLFRCSGEAEKNEWINRLTNAIRYTKSVVSVAAANSPMQSGGGAPVGTLQRSHRSQQHRPTEDAYWHCSRSSSSTSAGEESREPPMSPQQKAVAISPLSTRAAWSTAYSTAPVESGQPSSPATVISNNSSAVRLRTSSTRLSSMARRDAPQPPPPAALRTSVQDEVASMTSSRGTPHNSPAVTDSVSQHVVNNPASLGLTATSATFPWVAHVPPLLQHQPNLSTVGAEPDGDGGQQN